MSRRRAERLGAQRRRHPGDARRRRRTAAGKYRPSPPAGGGPRPPPRPPRRAAPRGQLLPADADVPIARVGPAPTDEFYSPRSWAAAGASPGAAAALRALGAARPSHIQAAAFRALASPAPHVALADAAGSGKTLAYLVPLLQALAAREAAAGAPVTRPRAPSVVVVAPTGELVAQVGRVCRALSRAGLRHRSVAATGGHPLRTQRDALAAGADVVVGTPGRLAELLAGGALALDAGQLQAIVLDEADVLLGESFAFGDAMGALLGAAPPPPAGRCVFVTATLPAEFYAGLERRFPGVAAALGPRLHRAAPGADERLVDCSGGDGEFTEETGFARKAEALLAALRGAPAARAMVFCNKLETCRRVENVLRRELRPDEGVEVLAHHAAIAPAARDANLARFLAPVGDEEGGGGGGGGDEARRSAARGGAPPPPPPAPPRRGGDDWWEDARAAPGAPRRPPAGGAPPRARAPRSLVLVCTDRASRGVDSAGVGHVVLFDFPRDPSEYLRRVGRTARGAGGAGRATVLALGRQVALAAEVIGRGRRGAPVSRPPDVMPV